MILFDSGASRTLISDAAIRSSKVLSKLETSTTDLIKFQLGNGQYLLANRSIKFEINIQGHKFLISAMVADNMTGVDLILGTDTLSDLHGVLDFAENRFKIKAKKVVFKPTRKIVIQPGQTKYVTLRGKVPGAIKNAELVLIANRHLAKMCPSQMLSKLHRGHTTIVVTNPSPKTLYLAKDRPVAYSDLGNLFTVMYPLSPTEMTDILADTSTHVHSMRDVNAKCYPHLNDDDPLLSMTERDIINRDIDLRESVLNDKEAMDIYDLVHTHRDAFSLYGELGSCPEFEVDIELTDETPFYIRPYTVNEADKRMISAELDKLVTLGIMGIGHKQYTSPVMLINKRGTSEKRVVTDLRYLNSRIRRMFHSFPLLSETMTRIGHSDCKVISVLDIKSAFHSLNLSKRAQEYTGVASFHGGKHYYYKKCPMGLSVSPGIWQSKIDSIIGEITDSREFCIAHHDDIIIFSGNHDLHKKHLASLFEALIKHGLKICPRKCKLFRDKVTYMGHEISINNRGQTCIRPLNDRCAAIRNMPVPKTPRQVRRFIGAVNYVSMFLPRLQEVIKPLHKLTRKGRIFAWSDEHQEAFDKVKDLLIKPPVLVAPKSHGRLCIYSDTSRVATGSHVTQTYEDGSEHIIAYYSKTLPEACKRYSVSELELYGLFINITAFKHLLQSCDFDACVDHSALVEIMKSKRQACTTRLQKLIERLSEYSFRLSYRKAGSKEMQLADCLSRAPQDIDSEIDKIVPVAFSVIASDVILDDFETANPVMTRAGAKRMGITVPPVHSEVPHQTSRRNETSRSRSKTPVKAIAQNFPNKARIDDGRSANEQTDISDRGVPAKMPRQSEYDRPYGSSDMPSMPPEARTTRARPVNLPAEPRLVDRHDHRQTNLRDPPPELYTQPKPLIDKIDGMVTRHIPKQYELDRMMDIIRRKIIRDYQLPVDVRQIKTAQETSPHFKPIYDFLAYDILPKDRKAAKSVQFRSEQFLLCNGVLFRLFFHDNEDHFSLQLAVPEEMAETIISRYHDGLLSNHQGVVRTYITMRKLFYMPQMFERINNYVQACSRCQQFRPKTDKLRPYHTRVPDSYKPFDRISLDFKSMPNSATGFKHIMVACCEITRFVICVPLKTIDAQTVCEAIIQKIITIFGPPSCIITDAASSLTGKLLTSLCESLGIDKKLVSVENHGSLHVERQIRTISNFLKVNLNQFGTDWVRFVATATYAYNSYSSPYLGNYSPFYLVFLREPRDLSNLSFNPMEGLSQSYQEYAENLKQKFDHVSRTVLQLQKRKQEHQNAEITRKLGKNPIYSLGQLVYLYKPTSSSLTANSKKIAAEWVGPLVIHEVLDRTHYILATLTGDILHDVFNYNRLKPCFIHASSERHNITHLDKLKEALNKGEVAAKESENEPLTVHFTDEKGTVLAPVTPRQVSVLRQIEPVDLSPYVMNMSQNKGLAAPSPLSGKQLEKQLDLLLEAPSENVPVQLCRARFHAGNLEVLVSMEKAKENNSKYNYWWKVHRYPEAQSLLTEILVERKVPCTGTPHGFIKKLHIGV